MSWAAPEVTRPAVPRVADERTMLEAWLDLHRQTLLMKCTGLSAEQLKRRSVPPSTLTLLGLVRHMAEVEREWFRIGFAGQALSALYSKEGSWQVCSADVQHVDTRGEAIMATIVHQGIKLAYEDRGAGKPAFGSGIAGFYQRFGLRVYKDVAQVWERGTEAIGTES